MSTIEYFEKVIRSDAFCAPCYETHHPAHKTGSHIVDFHFSNLYSRKEPHPVISVLVMPSGYGAAAIPTERGGLR